MEIACEEAAVKGLLEVFGAWTRKACLVLGARCGWINEYRLKVVLLIEARTRMKVVVFPGEEEADLLDEEVDGEPEKRSTYCICRS